MYLFLVNNAMYHVSVSAISYLKSIGIGSAGENRYRCITSKTNVTASL